MTKVGWLPLRYSQEFQSEHKGFWTRLEEIKKRPVTIAFVSLTLPQRSSKPRSVGLTMMIDKGLSSREFEDLIESHGEHIDFVKFGGARRW